MNGHTRGKKSVATVVSLYSEGCWVFENFMCLRGIDKL